MQPLSELLKRETELVHQMLDDAIEKAENGKFIDLLELQTRSEKLCTSIIKLPGREAKTFQSDIADIIRKLDSLEKILQEQVKNA